MFYKRKITALLLALTLLLGGCSFERRPEFFRSFRDIQRKQEDTLTDLSVFQHMASEAVSSLGVGKYKFITYGNCTDIIICQAMDALYKADDRWLFISAYMPLNKTWRITVIENAENGHCYYNQGELSQEYLEYRDHIRFEESFEEGRTYGSEGASRVLYDYLTDTPLGAESAAEQPSDTGVTGSAAERLPA